MKDFNYLKKSIYSGITFFMTVLILSIGYATLSGGLSTADKVASGSGLTATSWNRIIDGVLDLDTRLSNLSFSGGKVGIGTANPGASLDVRGALSAGDSKFYNSIQLTDSFNGATQSWIWAGGSNQLNLGIGGIAAGNTKMVIGSNGNVGIGTTSPSAKLEIIGDTISSRFYSISVNTGNTPSGVPITIYDTTGKNGMYLVSMYNFDDANNYGAFAIVTVASGRARVLYNIGSTYMPGVTTSGSLIQGTQTSGGSNPIIATLTKIQ